MQAGADPEGYSLSYSILLKKFLCFNLHKKRCSEASRLKVGSTLSFSNLEVSLRNYFLNSVIVKFSI